MRLAFLRVLVPLILLGCLGCQPRMAVPIYGPWEEGLTLAFEDPSQPQPLRSQDRMQARVAHSALAPGAPGLVQLDFTNLRGQMSVFLRHQDGGIYLVDAKGLIYGQSLPAHFPDLAAWSDRGTEFRVIGRATWDGAAILPDTADPVGIWVEARPARGPRRRSLYLTNLGEVETREERDGAWVTIHRLVARGFTDPPTFKHS